MMPSSRSATGIPDRLRRPRGRRNGWNRRRRPAPHRRPRHRATACMEMPTLGRRWGWMVAIRRPRPRRWRGFPHSVVPPRVGGIGPTSGAVVALGGDGERGVATANRDGGITPTGPVWTGMPGSTATPRSMKSMRSEEPVKPTPRGSTSTSTTTGGRERSPELGSPTGTVHVPDAVLPEVRHLGSAMSSDRRRRSAGSMSSA